MTHIKWPTEVGPPLPSNHWYTEAMRQSAKVRQQSERTSTAEARATQLELERDALLRVVTDNHVALTRAEDAEAELARAVAAQRKAEAKLAKAVAALQAIKEEARYDTAWSIACGVLEIMEETE